MLCHFCEHNVSKPIPIIPLSRFSLVSSSRAVLVMAWESLWREEESASLRCTNLASHHWDRVFDTPVLKAPGEEWKCDLPHSLFFWSYKVGSVCIQLYVGIVGKVQSNPQCWNRWRLKSSHPLVPSGFSPYQFLREKPWERGWNLRLRRKTSVVSPRNNGKKKTKAKTKKYI